MMAKLSHGPATHAVKSSTGPSPYPYHFYSTNYSKYHGNQQLPEKEMGGVANRTRGTGYIANFRPTLYYTQQLDHKDNPNMISLLSDNYISITSQHYRPTTATRHSAPTTRHQVKNEKTCVSAVNPDHMTSSRDHMTSETHSTYTHKPFRGMKESSQYTQREESGFTHAQNIEPITFRPCEAFSNDLSPLTTWRPTGHSIMKKDFTFHRHTTGNEGIPLLSKTANDSNGYVKGSNYRSSVQPQANEMVGYTLESQLHPTSLTRTQRQDPTSYSTITYPQHYSSYTHYTMRNGIRGSVKDGVRGKKELTGYSENNQPLIPMRDNDRVWSSHYTSQYSRPLIHTRDVTRGGCMTAPNGFSRGTQVHKFQDKFINPTHTLCSMHPSQARLILRQDPCYDDHTHYNKQK